MPAPRPYRSLLTEVAWRLAIWAAPLVLAVTALGYDYAYRREEAHRLGRVTAGLLHQAEREAAVFRLAEANAAAWAARFLALYTDPQTLAAPDFDGWYVRDEQGATRLREDVFAGRIGPDGLRHSHTSGFVGNNVTGFDAELRRRLVLVATLVQQYGPGWLPQFTNFHVSLPENALIIHWPAEPWGLKARADLRMTDYSTLRSTLPEHNPGRLPVWTPLYFDLTAGTWTVTYQLPIDHEGRHLANASFDIALTDLIPRLIQGGIDGAANLVITGDGHLVAGPDLLPEGAHGKGTVPIATLGNPQVAWLDDQLRGGLPPPGTVQVLSDEERGAWVVVTSIDGPGWALASIYPKASVAAAAHGAARTILLLSVALYGGLLAVAFLVLRTRVAAPIAALTVACERVGADDHASIAEGRLPLPLDDRSEIGLLARSFRDMAIHVRDSSQHLESLVSARTRDLEAANARLSELSLLDGLTGAFNRRAFDMDLAAAFEQARGGGPSFALLLCDVDHFKRFNDIYGHDAGDEVLRTIAQTLMGLVRSGDRVYRYGGEELAVILSRVDSQAARPIAHRIVKAVQDLGLRHDGSTHQTVTVSGGLAAFDAAMDDPRDLTRLADGRLYRSKQIGRNTLTV